MYVHMYFYLQSAWMFLEIVATFSSSLVNEVAVFGFWQQCVGQRDDASSTGTYTPDCVCDTYVCTVHVCMYVCMYVCM